MIELLLISLVFVFAILVVLFADHMQAKNIRTINDKIKKNPKYLKSRENRFLCEKVISQIAYAGPFTVSEARKLKKSLKKA